MHMNSLHSKTIYSLKLLESARIKTLKEGHETILDITRVPGGWIFVHNIEQTIFVPYSDEFGPLTDREEAIKSAYQKSLASGGISI
jgi:hypothetical protein